MCGIVGAFSFSAVPVNLARLERASRKLSMRGPDDSGVWSDSAIALAHRRLSIQDLSSNGHQPMLSGDGRYVIVFNGEMYNHNEVRSELGSDVAWRGTSDTETILESFRRWGPGCLTRFNGMFAFAVWDRDTSSLFLARDRLGVKPLYYSNALGEFCFASRPTSVVALVGQRPTVDPDGLRSYFELGYVPAPMSIFAGVRKFPPGHYAVVDADGMRLKRYWDFRHIEVNTDLAARTDDSITDELEERLWSAVGRRLISDVPLGAFLSGGTDSALILAGMRAAGLASPTAFTIGFDEQRFDELPAARAIASHLKLTHVSETLTPDSLLQLMPSMLESFDEPFADNSAFPTMAVARLARRSVTVCLTGDGGDELFGGYHYYTVPERLATFDRLPPSARRLALAFAARLPSHRAKLAAGALKLVDPVDRFHFLRTYSKDFGPPLKREFVEATLPSSRLFLRASGCFPVDLSLAEQGMRLDQATTLPDCYLQKVDLATMAFSLEARSPFVDYQLVEWAMRLPMQFKVRNGERKYILKRLLARHLPSACVYGPKKGFTAPVGRWLRGPLRGWATALFNDPVLLDALNMDRAHLNDVFRIHLAGKRDAYPILWASLMALCFVGHHVFDRSAKDLARAHL